MTDRITRSFEHLFAHPRAQVWEAMADTARLNEASGLPRYEVTEEAGEQGEIAFHGRTRIAGLPVSWDDLPCNWVANHWFEHRRLLHRGPFREISATLQLSDEAGGTLARHQLIIEPRGLAGRLLANRLLAGGEAMFRRANERIERWLAGAEEQPYAAAAPRLPRLARARAQRLAAELAGQGDSHQLVPRLLRLVLEGAENDVQRLRPLALAREWTVPGRDAVELCLRATRLGLLRLRWDLLCPRCRGAKVSVAGLDRLPAGAHCNTCNIDYDRDFARNVELSFAPAEAIRPIGDGEFCLLGPMSTPHIWAHVTVAPGERCVIETAPPPGRWRLRTLERGPQCDVEHGEGNFPTVIVTAEAVTAGPAAPAGQTILENRAGLPRTIVIEDRRWRDDVLTADRATTLQAFRDLFSSEVLRPGDEVGIARVALLFSDLRASTALYSEIGDASAYHLVREHFAYLAGIVREHDGAIVKTIGDAVMAAFHQPEKAVAAAITMQRGIATFNARAGRSISLKLGLHEGPCIAVTLNERLDYFGTTVNLASRLQDESRGDDIVLSQTMADDPAVAPLLQPYATRHERARLRGFGDELDFVRLVLSERSERPEPSGSPASAGSSAP